MASSGDQLAVEVFPASIGDAILIRCVSNERSVNILVDGGVRVRATYDEHLAARLKQLNSQGDRLDLLVVTHIDTDHIGGVLGLLEANGPANRPSVIEIGDIWHNGYRHLELTGREPSESEKQMVRSQVSNPAVPTAGDDEISVREAETLAGMIAKFGYTWNGAFGGKAALAGEKTSIAPGIELTLLSPTPKNLERLAYVWRRGLLAMGVSHEAVLCPEFEAAFEMELSRLDAETDAEETDISAGMIDQPPDPSTFVEDTSVGNGSSIAFLLDCFGLKTLFLGDSWPTVVLDQWDQLHPETTRDQIALIKVSHHGSRHNTCPTLLERVYARHYIVSTDGSKHAHPHAEALLWIADASHAGASLVFNYATATAEHLNQQELRERFGYSVTIGTGAQPVVLVLTDEASGGG